MLICSFFLNSCTPMGAIVTTTSAGAVVAESDRTVGEATDDTFIKLKIAEKYAKSKSGLLLDIDTSVRLGTVLLTGIVENQEIRIEAVKLAWEVNGVKEVLNEIEIGNTQKIKGEYVLVVEGSKDNNAATVDNKIEDSLIKISEKFSLTDSVKIVHKLTGLSKKELYDVALEKIRKKNA